MTSVCTLLNDPETSTFTNQAKTEAAEGEIICGGIDQSKYSGELASLPIVQSPTGRPDLTVAWTSLKVYKGQEILWQPGQQPAVTSLDNGPATLLDSGTTLIYVPQDVLALLAAVFEAQEVNGEYYAACAGANADISVEFIFVGGTGSVVVPASQMFRLSSDTTSQVCQFGFQPSTDPNNPYILGDIFLTSAYLVYDFDAYTISMAQAKWW